VYGVKARERIFFAHIEGGVGTERNAVRADLADQEFQRFIIVRERIEIKAP
jgi:hypothetical protein